MQHHEYSPRRAACRRIATALGVSTLGLMLLTGSASAHGKNTIFSADNSNAAARINAIIAALAHTHNGQLPQIPNPGQISSPTNSVNHHGHNSNNGNIGNSGNTPGGTSATKSSKAASKRAMRLGSRVSAAAASVVTLNPAAAQQAFDLGAIPNNPNGQSVQIISPAPTGPSTTIIPNGAIITEVAVDQTSGPNNLFVAFTANGENDGSIVGNMFTLASGGGGTGGGGTGTGGNNNTDFNPRDIVVRTRPYQGDTTAPAPPAPPLSADAKKYKQGLQDEIDFANLITGSNTTLADIYPSGLIDPDTNEVILDQGNGGALSEAIFEGFEVTSLKKALADFLQSYQPDFIVSLGLAKYGIKIDDYRSLAKDDPAAAISGILKAKAKLDAKLAKSPGDATATAAQGEFNNIVSQIKTGYENNLKNL